MGIFFPFKKILVNGHLFTSGDRLYRESAASVSAGIHLNSRLNYTLKVTGYHTQIDRYGAASGWSIGFSTALKLNDEILLIVDYDNLLTDQSDSFSDDIPKRGILSIESHVMDNQKLVYRLENEIPHEVNHHLFWQSTLRPTFRILGGFTSNPKTINFSGQFEKGKMTISVGTMYHPILSSSIGIRLFYNL